MGAWGPGLYQDDIAEDVKVRYEENLRKGLSGTEITKILIEENEYILDDAEEASVFWFALADTQWKFGRLEDSVKNKAIACLEEGTNLKIWEESEEPKAYKKRQEVLNALKERLLSEQPPEKKIRIPKIYKCEWNIGDVFAFKLESPMAEEMGLLNRYFIIQKIDETVCEQGHTVPIVYVRLSKDDRLPESEEEINAMKFVAVDSSIKLSREENRKVVVPIYVMRIMSTSKGVIPKKLIYLGNYENLKKPEKEHYPRRPDYMFYSKWGRNGSGFEKTMLIRYSCRTKSEINN